MDRVRFGREVLGITSSTLLLSKLLDQTSDNYLLEGSVGSFDRQDAVEQLLLLVVCIAIPLSQNTSVLDHANPPAHTKRCVLSQNPIDCPTWVHPRAFQHKICSNNHSGSEHSSITCDGSKQQSEEGWMRSEGW